MTNDVFVWIGQWARDAAQTASGIFPGDSDRQLFLETLAQTCEKTNGQVPAYGLMDHHLHRVVKTPRANLVAGMCWFLGT